MGEFHCPIDDPRFCDTGPIAFPVVVFPRTSVWIRHEGSRPFLADPSIVTIYNRAQVYERRALSPDGDRCDWFAVSDDVAREIARHHGSDGSESERPFAYEWVASTADLFLRQRTLLRRFVRGESSEFEAEEEVVSIASAVLALAHGSASRNVSRRANVSRRHRELSEAARIVIARNPAVTPSVRDMARALGTSPFHLCRVFREQTGHSMHHYRTELRVRLALERFESRGGGSASLSSIALDLGFASHSHFVRIMRARLGATPGVVRRALR